MFITTFEMEDQRGIIKEERGKTIDIVLFIDAKQDGGRKDIFFWFSAYYRQVQMFDVAISLVVELVLSASYILPPSSSPASFVLVFLLIFFLAFSLRFSKHFPFDFQIGEFFFRLEHHLLPPVFNNVLPHVYEIHSHYTTNASKFR